MKSPESWEHNLARRKRKKPAHFTEETTRIKQDVLGGRDLPVEELGIGRRAINCLQRRSITTLAELLVRSEADLMMLPGMGEATMRDIKNTLAMHGYALKGGAVDE